MFLFRLLIAFVLIVLFIPLGRNPQGDSDGIGGAVAAITAATAAVSDMRGFCDRQPGACAAGAQALSAMGERARAGAEAVQTLVAREQNKAPGGASAEDGETAYAPASATALSSFLNRIANANVDVGPVGAAASPRDTLLPGDRQPAWQKPTLKPVKN